MAQVWRSGEPDPATEPHSQAKGAACVARLFGGLMTAYLLIIWLASIFWVYRDIRSRTTDSVSHLISVAIAVVFPIVGLPIYLILRDLLHYPARLTALTAGALARARPHAADEIAQHILRRLEVPVRPPTR